MWISARVLFTVPALLLLCSALKVESQDTGCEVNLQLTTRQDVANLNTRNCTIINGSLHINGLEPSSCSNRSSAPLDTIEEIRGCLWIENLSQTYTNFSELLPNLHRVGGNCVRSARDYHTFVIEGSPYLQMLPRQWPIQLDNGCFHIQDVDSDNDLDFSKLFTCAKTKNRSDCVPCQQHSNRFYCPQRSPFSCNESYSAFNASDLMCLEQCVEIGGGLFLSGSWTDDEELEKIFSQLTRIRGYLVIANTIGLRSLSFFKNLVSIGESGLKWNERFSFALYDNRDLVRLWNNVSQISIRHTPVLVHGNPFLCMSDIDDLRPHVFGNESSETVIGGGNSLFGECNWSPEPPGSELKPNLTSISGETTLELNWTRIYKNATEYTYLGSELFYAEVNFTRINASTTTCPPSLQDILERSEMDFQFQRRLVLFGSESKQTLKGLNFGRHYAVYVRSTVLSLRSSKRLFDCSNVRIFSTLISTRSNSSTDSFRLESLQDKAECSWISWRIASEENYVYPKYVFEILAKSPSKECEKENDTSTPSAAGICPCSYNGITSVDNSTRNASVQFKYNNGSVKIKSFVLNKSGVSEFSLNILPCYIYYVRAKLQYENNTCSNWSKKLKLLPKICNVNIVKKMNFSAYGYLKKKDSTSILKKLNVSWTDPGSSLCGIVDYRVKFSGNISKKSIQPDGFRCDKNRQSFFCRRTMSNTSTHQLSLHFRTDAPLSLIVRVLGSDCSNWEQLANISVFVNATIVDATVQPSTDFKSTLFGGTFAGTIVLIVSVAFYVRRMKKMRKNIMESIRAELPEGYFNDANISYEQDEWEIDRKSLRVGGLLGKGAFGQVFEGVLDKGDTAEPVAIKCPNAFSKPFEKVLFLKEASVMKNFVCDYIVRLIGIISEKDPVYVVMELMGNGDLKSYLRSVRPSNDSSLSAISPFPFTEGQILTMAAEIASGMAYLTERKFVHRDLAARNCLVSSSNVVKIGDFGMARDVQLEDYYRKCGRGPMPIRWMAPESLRDGVFTHFSDVWSYGVVLWEIFALGALPYPGLSNEEVVSFVGKGNKLKVDVSQEWPSVLDRIMNQCWECDPLSRPSFVDILLDLPALTGCEVSI
ncbi:insulin receptor-like [Oscarella lobularis]|uniref:insulin receptor-like n=1 Tax=Oscarella lobularis TaxID=121494 RepID=UPI0033134466